MEGDEEVDLEEEVGVKIDRVKEMGRRNLKLAQCCPVVKWMGHLLIFRQILRL